MPTPRERCPKRISVRKTAARQRRPTVDFLEPRELLATFVVSNTADGGVHSLRWAINQSNSTAGADVISFSISGVGTKHIVLNSPLPAIAEQVTIDGYSQPGAKRNTLGAGAGSNAKLAIEISPANATISTGIVVAGGDKTLIDGLSLFGFSTGAGISLQGGTNTRIAGDFLGVRADGSAPVAVNNLVGAQISGSSGNTIGGTAAGARNVISGNASAGIALLDGANGNQVLNNLLGLDASGASSRGNGLRGVFVGGGTANTIGGTFAADRNVISGNGGSGVLVQNSSADVVQGNFIGLSASGTAARGNGYGGVVVGMGASNVTIGGTANGAANILSGNAGGPNTAGVIVQGNADATAIRGNTIGLGPAGLHPMGNTVGVIVRGTATNTAIGADAKYTGNVLSGNALYGLLVSGDPTGTSAQRNMIGLTALGVAAGNGSDGVRLIGGRNTLIGGQYADRVNVISANGHGGHGGDGINVIGPANRGTAFGGNLIGTSPDGMIALGNDGAGIAVTGTSIGNGQPGTSGGVLGVGVIAGNVGPGISLTYVTDTVVAGNRIGMNFNQTAALPNGGGIVVTNSANISITANTLSGNKGDGIRLAGNTTNTMIAGNNIGLTADLYNPMSNQGAGVHITGTTSDTAIGTTQVGGWNYIGANFGSGIQIDAGTNNSQIVHNVIGLKPSTAVIYGNGGDGITVAGSGVVIGGTDSSEANVIGGNAHNGIKVAGADASNTVIQSNYIGTDGSGQGAQPNLQNGILVNHSDGVTIGGTTLGAGNVISGNKQNGLLVTGAVAANIMNNRIGTSADGTKAVANGQSGIVFDSALDAIVNHNIVSGNTGDGIDVSNHSNNNLLRSNYIGAQADGETKLGNGGFGVFVRQNSSNNTIGATTPDGRNFIIGNKKGVVIGDNPVTDQSVANRILGNSIHDNVKLGIDLGNNGVTPNHNPEPTVGPNLLQNYPVLNSAKLSGTDLTVTGVLNGLANTTFRIELFANTTGDPSGFGQGQTFLGTLDVTTDATGHATINTTLTSANVAIGQAITATATSPVGNTSEFSHWIAVTSA